MKKPVGGSAIILAILGLLIVQSCSSSNLFPDVGTNKSSPMAMIVDSAGDRLYLVNSNERVLYRTGSLQVFDLTLPTAPSLLTNGTVQLAQFTGQGYLDLAAGSLYLANRESESNQDIEDHILRVNIDEASPTFLNVETFADGSNPYGMVYDAASTNIYTADYNSAVSYFTLGSPQSISYIDLSNLNMSDGTTLSSSAFREIAIVGNMAFVSVRGGGMLVVDLVEENADYFVSDFQTPRGIVTDGVNVYLTSVDWLSGSNFPMLYSIDPTVFPQRVGNTDVTVMSMLDPGVLLGSVQVGNSPQEVLYSTAYVFVTNFDDDTISVVNRAGMTANTTITVGDEPFGLALYSPGGTDTHLYVSNMRSNNISVVDLTTLTVVATF